MASTSFGRVFSRRVVRQFGLAEGREQMTDGLEEIVSDEVMQQAYEWVCQRRRDDSANDDVWDLRWRWDEIRPALQTALRTGTYRIGSTRRLRVEHEVLEIWSARDALVLKAVAVVVASRLLPQLSMKCYHLEGRGGSKAAVRYIAAARTTNSFVFRTDVKSYYASIDHEILIGILAEYVADAGVLNLLTQSVQHTIYEGGLYEDVERGISLGCPLSPLMGALYLQRLDERIEATGLIYARFMDDWVILAPTRWKLRAAVPFRSEIRGTGTVFPAKQRVNGLSDLADLYFVAGKMSQSPNCVRWKRRAAVRIVNETLAELNVEQHPDKTFIGRIERGFDFLGSVMNPAGLEMAPRAIEHCVERVSRLDEQGADLIRIGAYLKRWSSWAKSGLSLDGGQFVDRAMEAISQRVAELATPHWPLPHTLGPLALERISQGRKTTQTHQHHR